MSPVGQISIFGFSRPNENSLVGLYGGLVPAVAVFNTVGLEKIILQAGPIFSGRAQGKAKMYISFFLVSMISRHGHVTGFTGGSRKPENVGRQLPKNPFPGTTNPFTIVSSFSQAFCHVASSQIVF